jgi:hypothetical protein
MDSELNKRDTPAFEESTIFAERADDSLWAFFPLLLSAAALCLIMFFFLVPSFEAVEPERARSARPGAETSVTEQQAITERQNDKSVPSAR